MQFVGEDEKGDVVPVSVYYVPLKYGKDQLDEIYPIGAIFGTFASKSLRSSGN